MFILQPRGGKNCNHEEAKFGGCSTLMDVNYQISIFVANGNYFLIVAIKVKTAERILLRSSNRVNTEVIAFIIRLLPTPRYSFLGKINREMFV